MSNHPTVDDRYCHYCRKPLGTSRPNRKWCSPSCRSSYNWRLKLDANRALSRENSRARYRPRELMMTQCVVCGSDIEHRSLGRRYCSNRCSAKASYERRKQTPEFWAAHSENIKRRRARKKTSVVDKFTSTEIFVRDKYRCHICRRKCRRSVVVPHPLAPTIDHLIPLSCGGEHTRANVATACFQCNSVKGDRGGGEQLAIC